MKNEKKIVKNYKKAVLATSLGLLIPTMVMDFNAHADSGYKWRPNLYLNAKAGNKRSIGRIGAFAPIIQDHNSLVFLDLRFMADSKKNQEGNFGAGYRFLNGDNSAIWGMYGYFDRRQTTIGNKINQLTLGVERLSDTWDARFNVYLPQGKRAVKVSEKNKQVTYLGTNKTVINGQTTEVALRGFDIEVGRSIPGVEGLRLLGGGYYYAGRDGVGSITGARLRSTYDLNEHLSFEVETSHDNVRKTNAYLGIKLSIALGKKSSAAKNMSKLEKRMTEEVIRDVDIVANSKQENYIEKGHLHVIDASMIEKRNDKIITGLPERFAEELKEAYLGKIQELINEDITKYGNIDEESKGKDQRLALLYEEARQLSISSNLLEIINTYNKLNDTSHNLGDKNPDDRVKNSTRRPAFGDKGVVGLKLLSDILNSANVPDNLSAGIDARLLAQRIGNGKFRIQTERISDMTRSHIDVYEALLTSDHKETLLIPIDDVKTIREANDLIHNKVHEYITQEFDKLGIEGIYSDFEKASIVSNAAALQEKIGKDKLTAEDLKPGSIHNPIIKISSQGINQYGDDDKEAIKQHHAAHQELLNNLNDTNQTDINMIHKHNSDNISESFTPYEYHSFYKAIRQATILHQIKSTLANSVLDNQKDDKRDAQKDYGSAIKEKLNTILSNTAMLKTQKKILIEGGLSAESIQYLIDTCNAEFAKPTYNPRNYFEQSAIIASMTNVYGIEINNIHDFETLTAINDFISLLKNSFDFTNLDKQHWNEYQQTLKDLQAEKSDLWRFTSNNTERRIQKLKDLNDPSLNDTITLYREASKMVLVSIQQKNQLETLRSELLKASDKIQEDELISDIKELEEQINQSANDVEKAKKHRNKLRELTSPVINLSSLPELRKLDAQIQNAKNPTEEQTAQDAYTQTETDLFTKYTQAITTEVNKIIKEATK